jgi:hypothetical protein
MSVSEAASARPSPAAKFPFLAPFSTPRVGGRRVRRVTSGSSRAEASGLGELTQFTAPQTGGFFAEQISLHLSPCRYFTLYAEHVDHRGIGLRDISNPTFAVIQ